ncbi:amidase [Haliangium sp. UPWRP_2]|uniref:amidase n=1 Tax=Haliangium sp. UPWRP_2 TaxID=1931276 RepID=UPI000B5463A9|nr:amidase [Haliangium sp. UPWRP_2]PSM31980.1 amidase [Haliangium sp. UPWRP_2]
MDSLIAQSAVAQSAALRRGEVSVEELTRAYLQRIDRLQPQLAAFVQLAPERALKMARRLDNEKRRDPQQARGPLWGLPTAMKDIHMTRGYFIRAGSRAFRYLWSPIDDVSSAAVRRAGLVLLGKLTTSELAILPIVDTEIHPPTRNPHDRDRYSGGSSGGSGAAIASGMLPIAVASDGAGSIRIPAAFCGLIGHKPTRDLLPNPFRLFDPLGLSVVGPHARSVEDAAALMDLLSAVPPPGGGYRDRIDRRPPPGLRIRYSCQNPITPVEPYAERAVLRVLRVLEDLGHHVEPGVSPAGSLEEFLPMFRFLAAKMFVLREALLQPATRLLRREGRAVTMETALAARELFRQRIDAWLADLDVYVTPTVPRDAPSVGSFASVPPEELLGQVAPYGAFTAPLNAAGNPAISIPVRLPDHPLPLGVQLVGKRGDDRLLLALAKVILDELGTPIVPLSA